MSGKRGAVDMQGKTKTILQLILDYADGKPMPKRVKYEMMMDGYEYFVWDDEEYVNEADNKCFLSTTPWHHLRDEVEIIEP